MAFNFLEGEAMHAALRFATINAPEFLQLLSHHSPEVQLKVMSRLGHAGTQQPLSSRIERMVKNTVLQGVDVVALTAADLIALNEALVLALRYWDAFELFVEDSLNHYSDAELVLAAVGRGAGHDATLLRKVHTLWAKTAEPR